VRLIGVPPGTWETITFVAAWRHNKMTARTVIEGATTAEVSRLCAAVFGSTFRRNDIVVMDNCGARMAPAIPQSPQGGSAICSGPHASNSLGHPHNSALISVMPAMLQYDGNPL
jgi:hypothetical protein